MSRAAFCDSSAFTSQTVANTGTAGSGRTWRRGVPSFSLAPTTTRARALGLARWLAAGALQRIAREVDRLSLALEPVRRVIPLREPAGKVELDREMWSPERLVEQTLGDFREEAQRQQVRLEAFVTPSLDDVLVDRSRILLVLANIVSNALRHSSPGGTVTLRAEPGPACVRFTIADEGPGVPEEHRARIFDRFFRVPHDPAAGAGLGLSISREIVETHGGKIGVAGAPGDGATFWFTLPTHSAPSRSGREHDAAADAP